MYYILPHIFYLHMRKVANVNKQYSGIYMLLNTIGLRNGPSMEFNNYAKIATIY